MPERKDKRAVFGEFLERKHTVVNFNAWDQKGRRVGVIQHTFEFDASPAPEDARTTRLLSEHIPWGRVYGVCTEGARDGEGFMVKPN